VLLDAWAQKARSVFAGESRGGDLKDHIKNLNRVNNRTCFTGEKGPATPASPVVRNSLLPIWEQQLDQEPVRL